ncbi:MAG: branched-chain amino acid ABC transporter permease [Caldilineaceae bacterium]
MRFFIDWRQLLRAGVLAGIFTTYVALIGMIETFAAREIISGVLTLGTLLVMAPPIVAGYVVAQRNRHQAGAGGRLLFGLITGLFASVPTLILIAAGTLFPDIRQMFVNITPDLISRLTFDQEPVIIGALMFAGAQIGLGFLGAAVNLIPSRAQKSLLAGVVWVLSVGLLGELLSTQVIRPLLGRSTASAIFSKGALTPVAATILFVVTSGLSYVLTGSRSRVQQRYDKLSASGQKQWRRIGFTAFGIALLFLPWVVGVYLSDVLNFVGMYVLMALGLNIAVGLAGLLDLGYVTNFAVGAYVMAVLTSTGPLGMGQFNFWLILPIAVVAAMFTGFTLALPVLRMRGDYLAIATLGFGEIIRLLALSDWLKPYIGGAQGVLFIPKAGIPGLPIADFSDPRWVYYLFLAACLLMLFISVRLNNSRTGRQWMAMREDEDAAGAMGIDTMKTKMLAFTLSAASGGLAGAIFASKLGTIFPHSFQLLISVNALCIIIVGGMGSIPGIVVGALALIGLPELLREFAEYRLLLYGALLIVMMLVRPEGLWPSAVRRRELREEEEAVPAPSGD